MKTILYLLLALGLSAGGAHLFDASPTRAVDQAVMDTSAAANTGHLPESSVYHVDSRWTTQHNSSISWSSLRGRPQLVAFFFTHCGYACPRIVHDLKGLLRDMPDDEGRAVGVVLVSIDPEHDTPEALNGFAATHGLDWPQWTLLRGTDADIRELAAVLGARYKRQPSGEFTHTNTIVLLDHTGEVVARRDGSDDGVKPILDALTTGR